MSTVRLGPGVLTTDTGLELDCEGLTIVVHDVEIVGCGAIVRLYGSVSLPVTVTEINPVLFDTVLAPVKKKRKADWKVSRYGPLPKRRKP